MEKVYECIDPECVRNDAFAKTIKIQKQLEEVKEQKLLEKIRKIVREELKKETEDVYEVRVGDVRKDNYDGVYAVTYFYKGDDPHVDLLYSSGKVVSDCNVKSVKCDKLLARHDNWIDAVNGKEFKNEI